MKDYDYSQNGYYYVTLCVSERKNLLCSLVGSDALVAPSPLGQKVIACWNNISLLNENIEIDKFILMPNHIHGIIVIKNADAEIAKQEKMFDFEITERRGRRSLQGLLKDFKSVTTRQYKKMYGADSSLWQSSFYDEIIRNQEQYEKIWQYIETNPSKWKEDVLYC
ncbi:MAG: transposase [Ruthenibacterium sp.]